MKMYVSYDLVTTLHYKKYSEGLGTKQLKMEFPQIVQDKDLRKFVSQIKDYIVFIVEIHFNTNISNTYCGKKLEAWQILQHVSMQCCSTMIYHL